MCLDTVNKKIAIPTDDVAEVWKAFTVEKNYIGSPFQGYDYSKKTGVWIAARKIKLSEWSHPYISGFHAYKHKTPAIKMWKEKWWRYNVIFLPIEFRMITTTGKQDGCNVLVAQQMRIPKNWKELAINLGSDKF